MISTLAAGSTDLSSPTTLPLWIVIVFVILLYLAVKK